METMNYQDLKLLSAALTQFIENQPDGENQEAVHAAKMLDRINGAMLVHLASLLA